MKKVNRLELIKDIIMLEKIWLWKLAFLAHLSAKWCHMSFGDINLRYEELYKCPWYRFWLHKCLQLKHGWLLKL
jgi:hypothetical protein